MIEQNDINEKSITEKSFKEYCIKLNIDSSLYQTQLERKLIEIDNESQKKGFYFSEEEYGSLTKYFESNSYFDYLYLFTSYPFKFVKQFLSLHYDDYRLFYNNEYLSNKAPDSKNTFDEKIKHVIESTKIIITYNYKFTTLISENFRSSNTPYVIIDYLVYSSKGRLLSIVLNAFNDNNLSLYKLSKDNLENEISIESNIMNEIRMLRRYLRGEQKEFISYLKSDYLSSSEFLEKVTTINTISNLFVILHEYCHLLGGHFENFRGDNELESDQFAFMTIMKFAVLNKWKIDEVYLGVLSPLLCIILKEQELEIFNPNFQMAYLGLINSNNLLKKILQI